MASDSKLIFYNQNPLGRRSDDQRGNNPFVEGFNPKIKFERTQTIMEGASYCGFRYILEDQLIRTKWKNENN